jgi:ribosome recycling factor
MKKQNVFQTLAMVAFTVMALNPADPMAMINNVQTTFDLNGQPLDFSDATLETPMAVKERPESGKDQKGPKSPFERLLAALNLTPDQKALVERLQAAHKDCATAALEALKAAERSILRRANARSEEIKASAKAGTITREEARTQLRDLNKATREAIKSLPEREAARTALKDCDDAFLARLGRILDEKQKAILDNFIKARDARNSGGPRGGSDGSDSTGGRGGDGGRGPGGGGPTGGGDTVRPGGRG